MFKRTLLGVSALALMAASASAADLGTRYPVKAAVVPVQMFSWTGFYIGGNVGYAWGNSSFDYTPFLGPTYSYDLGNADGFTGGLQAGFNYQFANNVVLGLEADLQFADIGSNNLLIGGPVAGALASQSLDTYGTIRARLGYAVDRFLPYITGGAAWANTSYTGPFGWTSDSTHWGWTIGGGLEYAITNNWTVKGEYQYLSFDGDGYTYLNGDQVKTNFDMSVLKAGVNYKF
ncbi:outer membrane protein [Xanthobacter sp. KR7-225]|uniref:outer membrane protein n=1 Tax=Xanthobacter sp. KR7-225 TaxID=3156613 RepID=UPI0032B59A8D